MKSLKFRNVLVVEDDPILLDDLKEYLEPLFDNVVLAADGAQAYIETVSQKFDLIFTDINLPGMSGIQLISQLRSEGNMVPVILSSSSPSQQDLAKAIRMGVFEFIEKPFGPTDFAATLERILEVIRRTHALSESNLRLGSESELVKRQKKILGLLQISSPKKAV